MTKCQRKLIADVLGGIEGDLTWIAMMKIFARGLAPPAREESLLEGAIRDRILKTGSVFKGDSVALASEVRKVYDMIRQP
jgi:hypothetical protein